LTPRFNAVNHERAQEKPFKRFFSARTFNTRLKPDVNEKFSAKQVRLSAESRHVQEFQLCAFVSWW